MANKENVEKTLHQLQQRCQRLEDRQAIHDLLCRYSRALDRLDSDLLRSVFWPDAHVDLGPGLFQGQAQDLFEFAMQFQGAMQVTRHELSNILIDELDGDHASCETYVYAFHTLQQDEIPKDLIVYGRYLDEFERRDGEWRIVRRVELLDWAHERPATADWFDRQPPLNRGLHSTKDGLYLQRSRDK